MVLQKYMLYSLNYIHIWPTTSVKSERSIQQVTNIFIILTNWEINGTEEVGFVTPFMDKETVSMSNKSYLKI